MFEDGYYCVLVVTTPLSLIGIFERDHGKAGDPGPQTCQADILHPATQPDLTGGFQAGL